MFGATSSSRPPVPKISYWPSTREERKARIPPACTPVAREPIAVASGPGRLSCFSARASTSGSSSAFIPPVLASTQAGRSTTATSGTGPPSAGRRPVRCWTCATARAAASCSSRTTAAASSRVVSGPGPTSLRAVRPARSQSTIEAGLLIASTYAAEDTCGPITAPSRVPPSARDGWGGLGPSTAALGERRGDPVERRLGAVHAARGGVGQDGEGQQPAVLGDHRAGQAVDRLQRAGLRAHRTGLGRRVVVAAVGEGAVVAGDGQAGEDRGGLRQRAVGGVGEQRGQQTDRHAVLPR